MPQPEHDIPKVLYHATTDERLQQILKDGTLRPGADRAMLTMYRALNADSLEGENVFFAANTQDALCLSGHNLSGKMEAAIYKAYYNSNWEVFRDLVKSGQYKWAKFGIFTPVLVIPTDWIGELVPRLNPYLKRMEYLHKGAVTLPKAPEVIQVKTATVKHLVRVDRPALPVIPLELAQQPGPKSFQSAIQSAMISFAEDPTCEPDKQLAEALRQLKPTDSRFPMEVKPRANTGKPIRAAAYTVQMNFSGNDLFLTFGYLPGREPHSRATGRYFLTEDVIRPLRASRRAGGVPFRYCYSTRWPLDNTPPEHRLILSAGPETEEQLRGLWHYGPVTCCPLREMGQLNALVARLYTEAAETAQQGENLITFSQGLR